MEFTTYNSFSKPSYLEKEKIAQFLHTHLQEYGDPLSDIEKCIDYAMKERSSHGGFIVVAHEGDEIYGATIINKTGMEGYIPENILVYIAVDQKHRGKGIGKAIMEQALSQAQGAVALHVEPDNPARHLYEKLGFTNKYLEMRYSPSTQPSNAQKKAEQEAKV